MKYESTQLADMNAEEIRRIDQMAMENRAELRDSAVNDLGRMAMLSFTGIAEPTFSYEKTAIDEQDSENERIADEAATEKARQMAAPALRSMMYAPQYEQTAALANQERVAA
ncbi:MAG: hypothetical protein ABIR91_02745 [Candidatus Saccharimonadales bacterium]